MSDKEIFVASGLKQQLKYLLQYNYLEPPDGLMADKGFNIQEEISSMGLKLNLPPFATSGYQMSFLMEGGDSDSCHNTVQPTRNLCIAKIKKFKITVQS